MHPKFAHKPIGCLGREHTILVRALITRHVVDGIWGISESTDWPLTGCSMSGAEPCCIYCARTRSDPTTASSTVSQTPESTASPVRYPRRRWPLVALCPDASRSTIRQWRDWGPDHQERDALSASDMSVPWILCSSRPPGSPGRVCSSGEFSYLPCTISSGFGAFSVAAPMAKTLENYETLGKKSFTWSDSPFALEDRRLLWPSQAKPLDFDFFPPWRAGPSVAYRQRGIEDDESVLYYGVLCISWKKRLNWTKWSPSGPEEADGPLKVSGRAGDKDKG